MRRKWASVPDFFNLAYCLARVYIQETTGKSPGNFSMRFKVRQCKRRPSADGFCYQHKPKRKK